MCPDYQGSRLSASWFKDPPPKAHALQSCWQLFWHISRMFASNSHMNFLLYLKMSSKSEPGLMRNLISQDYPPTCPKNLSRFPSPHGAGLRTLLGSVWNGDSTLEISTSLWPWALTYILSWAQTPSWSCICQLVAFWWHFGPHAILSTMQSSNFLDLCVQKKPS